MTDIYAWRENKYPKQRRLPDEIREDNANGIFYTVDVLSPTMHEGQFHMWENTSPILSFIGPSMISHWRRAIASYQLELPLEEKK